MTTQIKCFISAGEQSGDLLAADLILELKSLFPDLQFTGVVGNNMRAAGVRELIDSKELSVMGLWDVAKQAAHLRMIEKKILSEIDRNRPELAILVDFPGLHFRLAEQFKLRGIKVIQYVAPKLWAWGGGRIHKLKRDFDLVLGILPFEEDFFCKQGVPYKYVGCPHIERISKIQISAEDLGLDSKRPIIACLPGSRMSEIRRILPILGRIKQALVAQKKEAQFLVPVSGNLSFDEVSTFLPEDIRKDFLFVHDMSLEVMSVAHVAIVASGTATLECALLRTPMVVLYAMDELSHHIAKAKVTAPWISLVNLILGKEAVKEYIQDIDLPALFNDICDLLERKEQYHTMMKDFDLMEKELRSEQGASQAAVQIAPFLNACII